MHLLSVTPPPPVSEFQVKEVCPRAAGGRQDKPSPDSGCSLGFISRLPSPDRPAGDGETDRPVGDSVKLVCLCPHYNTQTWAGHFSCPQQCGPSKTWSGKTCRLDKVFRFSVASLSDLSHILSCVLSLRLWAHRTSLWERKLLWAGGWGWRGGSKSSQGGWSVSPGSSDSRPGGFSERALCHTGWPLSLRYGSPSETPPSVDLLKPELLVQSRLTAYMLEKQETV